MYQLDISGEKFELYDFTESRVFLNLPSVNSGILVFDVWGVVIPTSLYSLDQYGLPQSDITHYKDLYVSGLSKVIIEGVNKWELEVELLTEDRPYKNILLKNGEKCKLFKGWGFEEKSKSYNYQIDCLIDWPFGSCYLSIQAAGKATIEFDLKDFVPLKEYVLDTLKYGYHK